MDKYFRRRTRDWEAFDKIELVIVPRYKTSGISGDEWRTGVIIKFWFKGVKVHEEFFTNMQAAIMFLPAVWVKCQEPILKEVIREEIDFCDQSGCSNRHNGKRRYLKKLATNEGWLDPRDRTGKLNPISHYRLFCNEHSKRGDCGLEDADANYIDDPLDPGHGDVSSFFEELEGEFAQLSKDVDESAWKELPKDASQRVDELIGNKEEDKE